MKNDGFSRAKSTEETREDYIRKSNPLAAFIMDCIEESQDYILLKQLLYSLFAYYCRENNLPAVNKDTFFKNISKHVTVTQLRTNRKDIPGRPYGFKGVTLTKLGKTLWSKQSSQSEVSNILLRLEDETIGSNKVRKTLDSSDWLDVHTQVSDLIDASRQSYSKFIEDLREIVKLRASTKGKCRMCGSKGRMNWQAIMHNDEWALLCYDCGYGLSERTRKKG